jgi:hypothetical protein
VQAFERTVLTFDWQIERGNIGSDALASVPLGSGIILPAPGAHVTLLHIEAVVSQPDQRVTAALIWPYSSELIGSFLVRRRQH